jgi:hypothetical protein
MPSTSIPAGDDLIITIVVVGGDVPFPIAAGATVCSTLMAGSSVSKLVLARTKNCQRVNVHNLSRPRAIDIGGIVFHN